MKKEEVKIGKSLVKIFELLLVLLCLGLTLWQIFKGINKYLSFPQGSWFQSDFKSQLSKESLPDLTFCPFDPSSPYSQNDTFKKNCGFSYIDLWASETCPDPEMNYHGIFDMSNLLMLLINSIRYWTGTCHPTVCFKTRSIQVYPQVVKPQNIHHAMPLTWGATLFHCRKVSKIPASANWRYQPKMPSFWKFTPKECFSQKSNDKFIKVSNEMMNAELKVAYLTTNFNVRT